MQQKSKRNNSHRLKPIKKSVKSKLKKDIQELQKQLLEAQTEEHETEDNLKAAKKKPKPAKKSQNGKTRDSGEKSGKKGPPDLGDHVSKKSGESEKK